MSVINGHGHSVEQRPDLHEHAEPNTKAVWWFLFGLLLFVIVAIFVMLWLYRVFGSAPPPGNPEPSALMPAHQVPPPPRLQTNAAHDLRGLRDREDAILNSYGWVDQKAGIARIPIDRAIDAVARQGLPARAPGETGTTERHR